MNRVPEYFPISISFYQALGSKHGPPMYNQDFILLIGLGISLSDVFFTANSANLTLNT